MTVDKYCYWESVITRFKSTTGHSSCKTSTFTCSRSITDHFLTLQHYLVSPWFDLIRPKPLEVGVVSVKWLTKIDYVILSDITDLIRILGIFLLKKNWVLSVKTRALKKIQGSVIDVTYCEELVFYKDILTRAFGTESCLTV